MVLVLHWVNELYRSKGSDYLKEKKIPRDLVLYINIINKSFIYCTEEDNYWNVHFNNSFRIYVKRKSEIEACREFLLKNGFKEFQP